MAIKKIVRNVTLEERDYSTVRNYALEKGLGEKGFSAAVRLIIREWEALQEKPTEKTVTNGEE